MAKRKISATQTQRPTRSTRYGENMTNGLLKSEHKPSAPSGKGASDDDIQLVLQSFRVLVADLCEQFNMGHPGSAIGMAALGVALWKYTMKYAPHQPTWFNRDRFLLSNGHACLFQYCNHYLAGYKAMTWEQLLSYHSERPDSLCPGHPEIEHEGIELTTGPLGQGIANAVGLAMASKHLAATYNRPGYDVVSNHIWVTVGDACMQEGVGCEAFSYAGHLKLTNLTVIYDNNQITCDGSVDLTNTEDVNKKMEACGWDIIDVEDGINDVDSIVAAMEKGRDPNRTKPLFINVRSIIGYHIPEKVKEFYADIPARGDKWVSEWNDLVGQYKQAYPELGAEFQARVEGRLPADWTSLIPKSFPAEDTPTRKSNNYVMKEMLEKINTFMVGTADLTPSVNLTYKDYEIFNPPDLKPISGAQGSYKGRYIHYGIREHVMAAIANGLAAYSPGTIIPITSSFFMFYLYAAPAVRMGALQRIPVIHVATHDSIGAGEDGPTHQPVELAALYRAMPNMHHIRPADSEEVAGAWEAAVGYKDGPSMISVSRHALPQTGTTRRDGVKKGAYVVKEDKDADVTLISIGAELHFALKVAEKLPLKARVVSFPSHALFRQQNKEYQRGVLRRHENIPSVVIEPYVSLGWERYADAGLNMRSFGHSLPGKYIYDHFGFNVEGMTKKIETFVGDWKEGMIPRGEFTELLEPPLH
ncbi:hypothetical protein Q7P37_003744 [Cladosporium fusiforme]